MAVVALLFARTIERPSAMFWDSSRRRLRRAAPLDGVAEGAVERDDLLEFSAMRRAEAGLQADEDLLARRGPDAARRTSASLAW